MYWDRCEKQQRKNPFEEEAVTVTGKSSQSGRSGLQKTDMFMDDDGLVSTIRIAPVSLFCRRYNKIATYLTRHRTLDTLKEGYPKSFNVPFYRVFLQKPVQN